MKNSPYLLLNSELEARYSKVQSNFPLAFYYIETELRLILTEQNIAHDRNIRNILNKYSLLNIFIFKIYFIVRLFLLKIRKSKTRYVYLSINRHQDLSEKLVECINLEYDALSSPKYYKNLLSFDKFFPMGYFALNSLRLRKSHKKIAQYGLINVMENFVFMQEMEDALIYQVKRVENLIRLMGFSGLILQNEHTFEEKITVKAANNLEIPVITVAHGYIQQPELITIAPFTANHMLLWTQSQKDFLDRCDSKFKRKTLFLGWPFRSLKKTHGIKTKILIVLTDVDNDLNKKEYLLTLRFLDDYIQRFENCRVRLHPASIKSNSDRVIYLINRYRSCLDPDPLEVSLASAGLVIGHDSSVLITSVMNNIPAVRFKETAKAFMPEVMTLNMDKILASPLETLRSEAPVSVKGTHDLTEIANSILKKLVT